MEDREIARILADEFNKFSREVFGLGMINSNGTAVVCIERRSMYD